MIHLNDFTRQWREIGPDVHATLERVGAAGWYILGNSVRSLERVLASRFGHSRCVAVNSGHDAIEIALRCLGLQTGDRVLTTPLSAFATTQAILRAGGEPVFVDIDEHGLIDLELCDRALSTVPEIRFMVPVHLYGRSLDLTKLRRLIEEHGLTVIEDCAQSTGATWHGQAPGSVGHAAATSFYPTKNLPTLGDGGALFTSSETIADQAQSMRHGGRSSNGRHEQLGCNSRLDELQAAILGEVMLPRLDGWLSRRRHNAQTLLKLIDNPRIRLPESERDQEPNWHLFPVRVRGNDRDALRRHLLEHDVGCGVHYPQLIPYEPAVADRDDVHIVGDLGCAKQCSDEELSLPVHPFLSDEELTTIATACNTWKV